MPVGIHTDPIIKTKVLTKIRDDGISVPEAAKIFNLNSKTIYRWLKEGVVNSDTSLILQLNRLKKENEQLYNLLGRATAELKHPKN